MFFYYYYYLFFFECRFLFLMASKWQQLDILSRKYKAPPHASIILRVEKEPKKKKGKKFLFRFE